jgi:protein-tyrosine phosphatase
MQRKKIDCDEILPNLYLGSAKASKDLDGLSSLGITHILNIAGRQHFPSSFVYKKSFFKDKDSQINAISSTELNGKEEEEEEVEEESQILNQAQLIDIFEWMDVQLKEKKKNKIFVHCMAGISRSASIVIGYLVWSKRFTIPQAYSHVKNIRSRIRPRFLKQLTPMEAKVWNLQEERSQEEIDEMISPAKEPKKGKKR